jgi:serine/threonine-protein kinase RIO1
MHNVELMLANQIVHGDLSAYNIMYRQGRITLIDFPQAVNPFDNPAGRTIFDRDIARVCDYFTAYGVEADAPALAEALWQKHGAGDLWTPVPLADGELDELMEEEGARRFTGSPSRR